MNLRLARMEEAVSGLKDRMTMLLTAVAVTIGICGILLTSFVAVTVFTNGRLDRLSDRVGNLEGKIDELPAKINSNLLQLTQTLASTITAARIPEPPKGQALEKPKQSP